ncbi:MAG: CoA transferase, partial [candidate division KSB1 bacterium]|nr:CoA transferase [candidate division KSB1 bacterium]
GAQGRYGRFRTVGPIANSFSGLSEMSGLPEPAMPAGWGYSYLDWMGAYSFALAMLSALFHRARTGEGQWIDASQCEVGLFISGTTLLDWSANGRVWTRYGNRSPYKPAAPHGIYRCLDRPGNRHSKERWCAITVFSDDEWRRLVAALGSPSWAADPRFTTLESRLAHAAELDRRVGGWTGERRAEAVVETLQAAGIAAAVVADAEDLCARDAHLALRGYWLDVESPEGRVVRLDGVMPRLSATPGRAVTPGPLRGEHTDQVLGELLGLDRAALGRLRQAGVIG